MGYEVAAYTIVWVGIISYLSWIALRLRGTRMELAAIEELVREHEQAGEGTPR
jgi:CcmD family protein